jgi:hypothetical protein
MIYHFNKFKNTRGINYDNIIFKSQLEVSFYKHLKLCCPYPFFYENERTTLIEGFTPSFNVFLPKKGYKELQLNTTKIKDITYQFVVETPKLKAYIEAKGRPNDVYPIKRKLFLKAMSTIISTKEIIFFEPHTIGQLHQCIEIIKSKSQ